jgi:hypothetical protein
MLHDEYDVHSTCEVALQYALVMSKAGVCAVSALA